MNLNRLSAAALAVALGMPAQGAETTDSVRPPHELHGVEVVGVKQMPTAGVLPVTKIRRAEILRLGIDAPKAVSEIVPNLFAPSYGSRMTSSIYMRGLGSRIDQAVVGLSIDGVPLLNKDAYDFQMADIASIEVLRGARCVLNGRNAMAGQINILTLSPRDTRGFRALAEWGRGNTARVSGSWYGGITESLSTSLTALYTHTDGFYRNTYNNSRVGRENNGSLRWKTVWAPSPALRLTNTASASLASQSGYPYQQLSTGAIAYNDTCLYRRTYISDGLTLAWAGKRVVVTSLTSLQWLDDTMTLDQDFTPADYFTLTQRRRELSLTEDLFAKGVRGNYAWLGGVFGFYRHSRMHAPVTFFDTGIRELIEDHRNEINPTYPIKWDSREFLLDSNFDSPSAGMALYHQSSLTIDNWTIEAGLRWEIEHVECDYHSLANSGYTTYHTAEDGTESVYSHTPLRISDTGHLSQTFSQLLPKIVVSRDWTWGAAYLSFTKGYKAGGFNTQMFSDVLQQRVMSSMGVAMTYDVDEVVSYRPEYSWNYEIGLKATTIDGHLSGEAIGFYIDCRDQQLTMFPPGTVTGRIMTNAGRTRSFGAELTAHYAPTDDLTLSAAYGYTNATFRQYNDGRQDYRGKRLPYAPAHTLYTSAVWHTPWHPGGLHTEFSVNVRAAGDIMWNEANTLSQPFYALAGSSFTFSARKWSLRLWGENITNTRYNTFYFLSMSRDFVQCGPPATFGATISLRLGESKN